MTYTCLVFDFFGVICSEIAPFWLAKYFTSLDAAMLKRTVIDAADRGNLSQQELFLILAGKTKLTPKIVEDEWLSLARIDLEVVALIDTLMTKYEIGLLTNSPSPFVRKIIEDNSLSERFSSIVVSSENGCAKPDQKIYEIMLRSLSVAPADALMIDDNPLNIEGAVTVGMGGIVFRSCHQLREAIAA